MIELDGRTGEGGGQLVRLAICLAALTTQSIRIHHVRGNRTGSRGGDVVRGGGLKSVHVASIQFLAKATAAEVEGLFVGSHTVTFKPRLAPSNLHDRIIRIASDSSAASTLLVLQAVLPFLLFASQPGEQQDPIELEIAGGTQCSHSLSWDYLDQVLLPTLEDRFAITVQRKLIRRGWSQGPASSTSGKIWLNINPVPCGHKLSFIPYPRSSGGNPNPRTIGKVDVSMIVPQVYQEALFQALVQGLGKTLPMAEVELHTREDSQHDSRWYVLLLARESSSGLRWAADALSSFSRRHRGSADDFIATLSRNVCRDLAKQTERGVMDEHLEDQLVVFQSLCDGWSSFQICQEDNETDTAVPDFDQLSLREKEMPRLRTAKLTGHGSMHTKTARWVVGEMLPDVRFFHNGDAVHGIGLYFSKDTS